jgi:hypothetical protein
MGTTQFRSARVTFTVAGADLSDFADGFTEVTFLAR